MQLELTKSGVNKVGMWCIGTLTSNTFEYNGLFNLDKEYKLIEGSIYEVSNVKLRTDRKGILRITLVLK